ncbi:hypothetical protein Tco_1443371, partial [Tanacetum coccineum]
RVLAKPAESEGFEQVVDFLNAHTIKYSLTVNPTIYTSCIEQFWATVTVKMVNGEQQLQALLDGKKIVVTKASVRRDLQLDDEEGMDCLPNATIFEELTRMGKPKRKDTEIPQSSVLVENVVNEVVYEERDDNLERATTTSTGLDVEHDRGNISKTQSKATPNEPSSIRTSSGGGPKRQDTMRDTIAQTRKHKDCSSTRDYKSKKRVKKLERKKKSRTHGLKRLYKVGLSARIDSSDDEASLGDQEDASKQGMKIHDIDADEDIILENVHDANMFRVHDLDGDEVFVETEEPVVNAATTTSTISVSAADMCLITHTFYL